MTGPSVPVRLVGCDDPGPSTPVRIVNLSELQLSISELSDLKVGDVAGGDYLYIDENGILRLYGAARAWHDELRPLIGERLTTPAGRIDYNFDKIGVDFQDNAQYPDDFVALTIQLDHDWSQGDDLDLHLHWGQESADVPNWLIGWRIYDNGEDHTGAFTLAKYIDLKFAYAASPIMQISDLADIDASSLTGVSAFLDVHIYRDTTNASGLFAGADPLVGDAFAKEFDVHLRRDGFGSDLEYTKT